VSWASVALVYSVFVSQIALTVPPYPNEEDNYPDERLCTFLQGVLNCWVIFGIICDQLFQKIIDVLLVLLCGIIKFFKYHSSISPLLQKYPHHHCALHLGETSRQYSVQLLIIPHLVSSHPQTTQPTFSTPSYLP